MEPVTYRLLPNDPGYRVGSDGTVWTCLVRSGKSKTGRGSGVVPGEHWRQLRPASQPNGARYVSIRRRSRLVHHLVLEAFVGPCPDGMECCHLDDDRTNNRLENLRWDTHRSNCADALRNGKQARGERHGNAKVTADVVRALRADYAGGGVTVAELADRHQVSLAQAARIIRREHWSHIV